MTASRREHFTSPDDPMIVNPYGRHINGSALRRKVKDACDQAGPWPRRWRDLPNRFSSQFAAGGLDIVTVQASTGHAHISTTSRYLPAQPATETAARFIRAFQPVAVQKSRPSPGKTGVDPESVALQALAHLDPVSRARLLQALTRPS